MNPPECLRKLTEMPPAAGGTYQLLPPATAAALQQLEDAAAVVMPTGLRELYQLSNGIAEYLCVAAGEDPVLIGHLLLPAEEAAAENRRIRQQPATPTQAALLVVALAYADGIVFGYRWEDLPADSAAIYAWLPIDDELVKLADSLPEFLLGWAEGKIRI